MMNNPVESLSSDSEFEGETLELSSDSPSDDSINEGPTPAKKRKVGENISFKVKVQNIFENLSNAAAGEFTVSGKIDAPLITIAIKNTDSILHFPLYENEANKFIKLFEQSPYGKGEKTIVDTSVRNSWELNSDGFEILNPAWKDFVDETIVAKLKDDMFTEISFTPSLYKLLLYKKGSFFKPHRDSEKVTGMFATLVIQLPSLYQGGQLIVRHDGKTMTSDFSSTADSSNTFGTFYTAFYCDCEHEVRKVTEGYRICLVYNLISHKSEKPTAPRRHEMEVEMVKLIEDWEQQRKLVYVLKHKYTESSLSFDNLKTTDRAVANFLIYIAKHNDLNVFLGIINMESSGQSQDYGDSDADFDSDDQDFSYGKSYKLSKLISIGGDDILTSSLSVNFENEVIPEDCFDNVSPYRKTAEPTGNAGTDVTRFYKSAAIVFFPKQHLLEVLKKSGAQSATLDKLFLKEIEAHRGKAKNDNVNAKLKNWTKVIISSGNDKSLDVIKAIVGMKDIKLIQSLFASCVHLNETKIALLVDVCEQYGWKTFSKQIPDMFEKLTKEEAVRLLQLICDVDMDGVKKTVVHNVMKVILNKSVKESAPKPASYSTWYVRPPTAAEKMAKRSAEQEFLLSASRLAEKVNYNMSDFAKTKSLELFVPVLLRLVPVGSKKLQTCWKDIAKHFLHEMKIEAEKPSVVPIWRRTDRTNCSCRDCGPLNAFLASDQETISFRMGKDRRMHLHQRMNPMQNISHETDRGGSVGVLVIRKTAKSGADDAERRLFSINNLPKLRAIV